MGNSSYIVYLSLEGLGIQFCSSPAECFLDSLAVVQWLSAICQQTSWALHRKGLTSPERAKAWDERIEASTGADGCPCFCLA